MDEKTIFIIQKIIKKLESIDRRSINSKSKGKPVA